MYRDESERGVQFYNRRIRGNFGEIVIVEPSGGGREISGDLSKSEISQKSRVHTFVAFCVSTGVTKRLIKSVACQKCQKMTGVKMALTFFRS